MQLNILIGLGVDINKENNNQDTPLFIVCKNGDENISNYLVEHGADLNKENDLL